eukprot:736344-Prymnesium_polylepis.1
MDDTTCQSRDCDSDECRTVWRQRATTHRKASAVGQLPPPKRTERHDNILSSVWVVTRRQAQVLLQARAHGLKQGLVPHRP